MEPRRAALGSTPDHELTDQQRHEQLPDAMKTMLIQSLSHVLQDQYVCPAVGEHIILKLREGQQSGKYTSIKSADAFAKVLTEEIQRASLDLHMRVIFCSSRTPAQETNFKIHNIKALPVRPSLFKQACSRQFGFSDTKFDTESQPGKTIATISITSFLTFRPSMCTDGNEIRKEIGAILSTIAECDALLIDLRNNTGGDPQTVSFMMSYFLGDGSTSLHLLDMLDRNGAIEEAFFTTPENQLPAGNKRYGASKPLWVLTSRSTVSGGEDMSNHFQKFERGIIVGQDETTAGAANPVTKTRYLCAEEFGNCWTALVPNLRPAHATDGAGWEGVGIRSDVVATQGEWKHLDDAEAVAKALAVKFLEANP